MRISDWSSDVCSSDLAAPDDGVRILIDRLWPRGVSKAGAALDEWMKEIAPSTELRKWFGHDPARWDEFQRRYRAELTAHPAELDRLRALAGKQVVTLVYSAHDEAHNDAVVQIGRASCRARVCQYV